MNGQPGQNTKILVCDDTGRRVFEKEIGDYTVNEGEVLAILACFMRVAPDEKITVYTDSQIAKNWITRGFHKKSKARSRTKKFVEKAHNLFKETNSVIEWVRRDKNKAGLSFEFEQSSKLSSNFL